MACFIEIYINIYFDNRPTVLCFRDNLRNPPRNIEYCARKISLHKWIYTTIIIMLLYMVNLYPVRWNDVEISIQSQYFNFNEIHLILISILIKNY